MLADPIESILNISSNVAHLEFIDFSGKDTNGSIILEKGVQLEYFCSDAPRCLHKTEV